MTATNATDSDIQTFTRKLEEFGSGLTPSERTLLAEILVCAANAPGEDVEGHTIDPGMLNTLVQHMATAQWQEIASHLNQIVHHVHHVAHTMLPGHPVDAPGSHFRPS